MTPQQIRQALINTRRKPRNHAPAIYRAIQNDETPGVDSAEGFFVSNEVREHGQKDISIS
jgi:hypothetical protein